MYNMKRKKYINKSGTVTGKIHLCVVVIKTSQLTHSDTFLFISIDFHVGLRKNVIDIKQTWAKLKKLHQTKSDHVDCSTL